MKKAAMGVLCLLALFCIAGVYIVGGQIGAYSWTLAVFLFAPAAILAFFVQAIVLLVSLHQKKDIRWNLRYLAITIVFALPITVLFGISPISYPTHASADDALIAAMPVDDAVLLGGKTYKSHAMWPCECYAYDIVKEPYDVGSENLDDYGIFGCDVYSPVSGTVIAVEENEPDITPNTDEFTSSMGNYICIRIDGQGTYLLLAHLKQNSIAVRAGDSVTQKQFLGKVGNSGTTSEPHLHIQHQRNNPDDVPFPTCAEGLPIIFN